MTNENELREKLRKIEALFAGAKTAGEKAAAGAAADRIRQRLADTAKAEALVEMKFSIPDTWSMQLFCALARRYGLRPFRYRRQHRQTVMIKAPRTFIDTVFWPEFSQLDDALTSYLAEVTDRVIREEVHGEGGGADEVADPPQIPGR
ncbi:hypothetical protein [Caenispirillum bisanense]|uniref:Uncharacterized protein n=1 Tax=Caenispirillum bisanense TaxID=414052 RepID=A0A286GP02_9PROT|nr:hypothetical protein [Caenispirillum bisanense]SOD97267.1 hypothetical protein SAMN05421508_106358 [Caenispirillum bisanense]